MPCCHSVAPDSTMGAFARVVLMADWMRDMSCLCLKCCVTSFPKEYTSTWRAASGSIPLALQADKARLLQNSTTQGFASATNVQKDTKACPCDEHKCKHSSRLMQAVRGVAGSR